MKRWLSVVAVLLSAICLLTAAPRKKASAKSRDINTVKTEQQKNNKEIKETNRAIADNTRRTEKELAELNAIRRNVKQLQSNIGRLRQEVDSADARIELIDDSVRQLEGIVDNLQKAYIESLRKLQPEQKTASSKLAFVFGAHTMTEAMRRIRYMGRFAQWHSRQQDELKEKMKVLDDKRRQLTRLRNERAGGLRQIASQRNEMQQNEAEATRLVTSLQSQGRELQQVLKQKQERAASLNAELNRLIAAEQERLERQRREREQKREQERKKKAREQKKNKTGDASPDVAKPEKPRNAPATPPQKQREVVPDDIANADTKLTGDFAAHKGRLLFPVGAAYRMVHSYGRQRHPDMQHVVTDNNGIDFEVKGGTRARAVFAGEVASVLQVPGYNTVVMLRHGEYYTVYTNLVNLAVRTGQQVTAGQALGSVWADPERQGYGTVHFEVRRNRQTLNPMEWVR